MTKEKEELFPFDPKVPLTLKVPSLVSLTRDVHGVDSLQKFGN